MSPQFHLPEQNAIAAGARLLVEAGADQQIVLGVLRKSGLSKIDSIRLLSELVGIPMMQAKNVVQASRAWSHTFDKDTDLQASIADALEALRREDLS